MGLVIKIIVNKNYYYIRSLQLYSSQKYYPADIKNTLEQLCINHVLVVYYNNYTGYDDNKFACWPYIVFWNFILTCVTIIGCINNVGNKHKTRIPVDIF